MNQYIKTKKNENKTWIQNCNDVVITLWRLKVGTKKRRFLNFGLEQKLDHHDSCVEFHGDSDGNGFKAQKPIIDPLIGPNLP